MAFNSIRNVATPGSYGKIIKLFKNRENDIYLHQ